MDTKDETILGFSLPQTLEADRVGFGATEPEDMLKYAENHTFFCIGFMTWIVSCVAGGRVGMEH